MTELNGGPDNVPWPEPPEPGGDPVVDSVAGGLTDLPGLPVEEHLARYTEIHDALLSALDSEDT
ncbi:hypothetical protein BIU82_17425 [Arthrobacter sp. SW1]|uniref:hypothetical protein n=1 Tax=Arthrobacter sp. SW1 TaxID=1920889 RepID=UPI000877BD2F|nr:hypothetical protein [Arthrobacter sp. SW1]OFI38842.1 hypothetical protein BIU82_17425 [Arthrobacter sp. SW1]